MLKKVISMILITVAIMFIGCSSDGGEGESRLTTQQLLDNGDYQAVIDLLEGVADSDDEYLALASAYMGRAGFGLTDIITAMATSNDVNGTGFAGFASTIASTQSATALSDLGKASTYYEQTLSPKTCQSIDLTNSEQDVCLFLGLSSMVKTATTLSYLGDLSTFGGGGSNDELNASMIALQYAIDAVPVPGVVLEAGANVTFTPSNNSYRPLEVTVNTVPYYHLMTTVGPPNQTIITDGNCTTTFASCPAANNTDCFACPVVQDPGEEDLSTIDILVDSLNGGLDSIIGTVSADSDVALDISTYKSEIGGADGVVTEQELIDYLNTQN